MDLPLIIFATFKEGSDGFFLNCVTVLSSRTLIWSQLIISTWSFTELDKWVTPTLDFFIPLNENNGLL